MKYNEKPIDIIFKNLKNGILVETPYIRYEDSVLEFIKRSSIYCHSMYMTIYRADLHGRLIEIIKSMIRRGIKVYVYIETRANNTEKANKKMVKILENIGAYVSTNHQEGKIHLKACALVGCQHTFVHVGTGNYNEVSGNSSLDYHFFTMNKRYTQEILSILKNIILKKRIDRIDSSLGLNPRLITTNPKMIQFLFQWNAQVSSDRIWIMTRNITDKTFLKGLGNNKNHPEIIVISGDRIFKKSDKNIKNYCRKSIHNFHQRFYIFDDKFYISSSDITNSSKIEILVEIPKNIKILSNSIRSLTIEQYFDRLFHAF